MIVYQRTKFQVCVDRSGDMGVRKFKSRSRELCVVYACVHYLLFTYWQSRCVKFAACLLAEVKW